MKIIIFILITASSILFSLNAHAQESWEIKSFSSDINILQTGVLHITETIEVDFGTVQKHGIYRDIPFVYQNKNSSKSYTQVEVQGVLLNGQKVQNDISKNSSNLRIKIGDPDKTITGINTYKITYSVEGVVLSFENYDELYWNVTGDQWEVPINFAKATVTLPKESILQISCYQGYYGQDEKCEGNFDKASATFQTENPLELSQGMTIAVGFEKGAVPILTVEPPKTFLQKILSPISLIAFATGFLSLNIFVFLKWFTAGRDFWRRAKFPNDPNSKEEIKPIGAAETLVVEFDPPQGLRPAQLGTLMDQKADTLDVTATIVDLAQRGFITIVEKEKSWTNGKVDYVLKKHKKETKGLLAYEKLLLDELFDTKDEVTLSQLKNKFYQDLAKVKVALYQDVVDKKLFPNDPEKVRAKYFLLAIFAVIFTIILIIVGANLQNGPIFMLGLGLFPGSLHLTIAARFMPRRTAYGRELYAKAKGYELFLEKAEKYRQQFFERKNLFNEILPYAIIFGLTEKLAKAFKDLGLPSPQPNWYVGTHPFNVISFGQSVNSFSNSLSSSIASAPSSSGSGGGGFSGGGGGGGGGGSW